MSMEVLLNGRFVPYREATVAVDDRGFQFSESVYEVIRVYRGRPFEMERHMRRFQASADAIGLELKPGVDDLAAAARELLRRSGLQEAFIYLQATTGAAPRIHLRPEGLEPTVLAMVSPATPPPQRWLAEGISAITVPDDRWARCYVKTTMLLPNTLAKRRAVEAGCDDAIFVRDGFVTEATAGNVFALVGGTLATPPRSNYILHGVTRDVVLELAAGKGMPATEGPIPVERLYAAEEVILTATGFDLLPITTIDGRRIGTGRPGDAFARLLDAYRRRTSGE